MEELGSSAPVCAVLPLPRLECYHCKETQCENDDMNVLF